LCVSTAPKSEAVIHAISLYFSKKRNDVNRGKQLSLCWRRLSGKLQKKQEKTLRVINN
jgi:hypothetical protein